jgi:hypothetical protein
MEAEVTMAAHWVPFEEGLYRIEEALIVAQASGHALGMTDAVLEVFADRRGLRHVQGSGKIRPSQLVDLLEEGDALDLLLDLGGPYKYHLIHPELKSGKVFAAGVQATVRFAPRQPWQQLNESDYRLRRAAVALLDS